MSFRYQFYRLASSLPKGATFVDVIDNHKPFDNADEIMAKLDSCFPSLRWHQAGDVVGQPWIGEGAGVAAIFSHEQGGEIDHVLLKDCSVDDVRRAAKALKAVAIDAETDAVHA